MKPAHPDPAEILLRVRQQLILAQVRIMELEDARDEIAARSAETGRLLSAAQSLADQKLDEAAHSEKVRAELQAQHDELQQLQLVTQAALEAERARLHETAASSAAHQQREMQLEAELRGVKASRSWRWTAWLRSLGSKNP
jgi:hypothetical protein